MMSKKQKLDTKFFAKNKLLESTDHEAGLSDATRRKQEAKIVMKVRVLQLKCVNSMVSGSQEFLWLIYDSSNNVMHCDVCRKEGPDITENQICYRKEKFKRESLVY